MRHGPTVCPPRCDIDPQTATRSFAETGTEGNRYCRERGNASGDLSTRPAQFWKPAMPVSPAGSLGSRRRALNARPRHGGSICNRSNHTPISR
jgi:hypothetical protein